MIHCNSYLSTETSCPQNKNLIQQIYWLQIIHVSSQIFWQYAQLLCWPKHVNNYLTSSYLTPLSSRWTLSRQSYVPELYLNPINYSPYLKISQLSNNSFPLFFSHMNQSKSTYRKGLKYPKQKHVTIIQVVKHYT